MFFCDGIIYWALSVLLGFFFFFQSNNDTETLESMNIPISMDPLSNADSHNKATSLSTIGKVALLLTPTSSKV